MNFLGFFEEVCFGASVVSQLSNAMRNKVLNQVADVLIIETQEILEANQKDMELAKSNQLKSSLLERLLLTPQRIQKMGQSLKQIAALPDPLGVSQGWVAKSGIHIERVSTPLGVIGIIYESRPNVTSEVAALCIKSGNAVILRGGSEAVHTNTKIINIFHTILKRSGLPTQIVGMYPSQKREDTLHLLKANAFVDLIIPRGGEGLVEFVSNNTTIPIMKHDKGVCHIFAHKSCSKEKSLEIIKNAKTSRPSVCNALETLLIDKAIANEFLPKVAEYLEDTKLRGCPSSCEILGSRCEPMELKEYHTEYGDNILSLRVVDGLQEALKHIKEFSSKHSDGILCEDYEVAESFLNAVDSACVYVNASTRFSDGGEFGFGAEVGIATTKLHVRGPVGVQGLTTYKYKIRGHGEIRG